MLSLSSSSSFPGVEEEATVRGPTLDLDLAIGETVVGVSGSLDPDGEGSLALLAGGEICELGSVVGFPPSSRRDLPTFDLDPDACTKKVRSSLWARLRCVM